MRAVRKRWAALAAAAALIAVAPPGAVHADEYPIVTTDGTICYEWIVSSEGNHLTLVLSQEVKWEVRVVLVSEDGTATAPDDYRPLEYVAVYFPPGTTEVRVPLQILADKEREGEEFFIVKLDSVSGAVPGTDKVEVLIRDGEPPKGGKG